MSSEYRALIESRLVAYLQLEVSSVWQTWKAANDVLSVSLLAMEVKEDGSTPLTSPEALVDNADTSHCVLIAYGAVQLEEELREQLLRSREWQSVQQSDSDVKQFARTQLKKRPLQKRSSASPSRIRRWTDDDAAITSLDGSLGTPQPCANQLPSRASPPSLFAPSLSLSQPHCSSSSDSSCSSLSPLEAAAALPVNSPPPPTELVLREVNEIAPLPGHDQWNALCPGLAKLGVVGTLADGSCGQSTAHQALHITPWLRSPSRRANNSIRRHPYSATPTREQLLSLNKKLSEWLSSEEGRQRWAQLCEQTRHALPAVDLQSTEDALDEMRMLTTPVGLSWWMIFAEV